MLKSKLSKGELEQLHKSLRQSLVIQKIDLEKSITKATNDPPHDIEHDYLTILNVIDYYKPKDILNSLKSRKPKGRVLIILSYNEPLIMSIEPLLNALAVGNEVYVRPSSISSDVFESIWKPVIHALPWLNDRLNIISKDHEEILKLIPSMQAVYFFGSQHAAKDIGIACANNLVEFWPETESADFAIYTNTSDLSLNEFSKYLFKEAFTHSGQICQRLHGVFVYKDYYEALLELFQEILVSNNSYNPPSAIQLKLRTNYDNLVRKETKAEYIRGKNANEPTIISNIDPNSPLCQNAFFLPTLWIIPYQSNDELLLHISKRPLQFGCNIWSSDQNLIDAVSNNTHLTRITLNTSHVEIRRNEGWGGSQPTSFGGYMQWLHKFSNGYTIIQSES